MMILIQSTHERVAHVAVEKTLSLLSPNLYWEESITNMVAPAKMQKIERKGVWIT